MAINQPFDKLFSSLEIEKLRALYPTHGEVHPLVSVALHPGRGKSPDQIAITTCTALTYVLQQFGTWATSLKSRLQDSKNWTHAESALAEIRACGALLQAGFNVALGTRNATTGAKPDFVVETRGGKTTIDVWGRNRAESDVKAIKTALTQSKTTTTVRGGTISTAIAEQFPFGRPNHKRPGDTGLANMISKIAAIKEREHQAEPKNRFVIWVDLQSHNTLRFDFSYHLNPLISGNGQVMSGGYWHGLYGRKGDELLDPDVLTPVPMQHDGRFYQKKNGLRTRVTAFIFSSPEFTAVLENPRRPFLLVPFRNNLIRLPGFDISLSLANWSDGLVQKTVNMQRAYTTAVRARLKRSRPFVQ